MADSTRKPWGTTAPTHSKDLPMTQGPSQPVKSPIPNVDRATIAAMTSEAMDGEEAGAEGMNAPAPTSNGALGAYRSAIVPPDGFHVP
jgi:hypothetical protein